MHFKFTSIFAIVAIAVTAAPMPTPATEEDAMIPRLLPGNNTVSTNGTVQPHIVAPDRTMTHTAVTNTTNSTACSTAFETAQTTIGASQDLTTTLNGLISQNKAIASLVTLPVNIFKSLWPGYTTTIKPEFKPFAVTLPPTDAICKAQIDVCLNSLLSTFKLVTSSPAGAAEACVSTK